MTKIFGNHFEFTADNNYRYVAFDEPSLMPERLTERFKCKLSAAADLIKNLYQVTNTTLLKESELANPPPLAPPRCRLIEKDLFYENGTVNGNLIIKTVNRVYLKNCKVEGEVIFLNSKGCRSKGKIFIAVNTSIASIEQFDNTRKFAAVKWYLDFRE